MLNKFYNQTIILLVFVFYVTQLKGNELDLYTEQFPPFNYIEDGTLKGINLEIIKSACKRANITCKLTSLPWNRAYNNALKLDNAGVLSTSRSEKREDNFLWVGPLVYGTTCFYKLASREDIQIENSQSIKHYTVGIPREDIYQKVLESLGLVQGENFITFAEKHEDTRMFSVGKLDLIIGSSLTLKSQLAHVGLTLNDVVPVLEFNDKTLKGNFLALNKNVDPKVVNALQKAMNQLNKDGITQQILDNYIDTSTPDSSLPENLHKCLNGAANY